MILARLILSLALLAGPILAADTNYGYEEIPLPDDFKSPTLSYTQIEGVIKQLKASGRDRFLIEQTLMQADRQFLRPIPKKDSKRSPNDKLDDWEDILPALVQEFESAGPLRRARFATSFRSAMDRVMRKDLDPYFHSMTPGEHQRLEDLLDGSMVGLGLVLGEQKGSKRIEIRQVVKGSPADNAGLSPGDLIKLVNREAPKDIDAAAGMIWGSKGEAIEICVDRGEVTLTCQPNFDEVEHPNVYSSMIPETETAYLHIESFDMRTPDLVREELNKLQAAGMKSIVIDLMNNGGGLVPSALETTALFLPDRAPIMDWSDRRAGVTYRYVATEPGPYHKMKMTILVNGDTASASEIFAGGLLARGNARLWGKKSHGKGTGQRLSVDQLQGCMKISCAQWKPPGMECIQGKGFMPDDPAQFSDEVFDDFFKERENALYGRPSEDFLKKDSPLLASVMGSLERCETPPAAADKASP